MAAEVYLRIMDINKFPEEEVKLLGTISRGHSQHFGTQDFTITVRCTDDDRVQMVRKLPECAELESELGDQSVCINDNYDEAVSYIVKKIKSETH